MGTDTNGGTRIAFREDLGLPTASVSFSPPEPRMGQFQAFETVYSPLLDVPVMPKPPKTGVTSPYPGSCLASVQHWIPDFPKGVGRPANLEPTLPYPVLGRTVLTTEGPVGHIGLVTAITHASVSINECNFIPGKCGTRTIPLDSPVIRGYY